MNEITYRRLEKKDLKEISKIRNHQLHDEGADSVYDLTPILINYYEQNITDETYVAWLAMDGDKIIGTCGISIAERSHYFDDPDGKIGMLSSVFTLKDYRRRGIATTLLNKIVNEAKAYGCDIVDNSVSQMGAKLYEAYGFEKKDNNYSLKIEDK